VGIEHLDTYILMLVEHDRARARDPTLNFLKLLHATSEKQSCLYSDIKGILKAIEVSQQRSSQIMSSTRLKSSCFTVEIAAIRQSTKGYIPNAKRWNEVSPAS
jgi:hypothetical protein